MVSEQIKQLLLVMEYPATRDDLVHEGRRQGCDLESLHLLRALPVRSFHGIADVRSALEDAPKQLPKAS